MKEKVENVKKFTLAFASMKNMPMYNSIQIFLKKEDGFSNDCLER